MIWKDNSKSTIDDLWQIMANNGIFWQMLGGGGGQISNVENTEIQL